MRIPSWKALVHGLLCVAFCGSILAFDEHAKAQDAAYLNEGYAPYPQGAPPQGAPGPGVEMPPPGYGAPGGPGYGGPDVPPPTAWPEKTPFIGGNYERVENNGGIWEYDWNTDPKRKYKFGLDWIMGWGLKPGPEVLIGDPNAYIRSYPTDDTFPFPPFTRLTNLDFGTPQPYQNWPARRTNNFDDMDHYGMRLTFGWENYDHSEWQVSGFFLQERLAQYTFNGRTPNPTDVDLFVFRLPVNDGTATGTSIPYDTQLILQYDQRFAGVDFDFWTSPFFEAKNVMLRMEYGVKYLYAVEKFGLSASDSGLDYTYTANTDTVSSIPIQVTDPFTTTINSKVTSNLIGPAIGLRGDLGGDAFKVWSQIKTGALANIETTTVTGHNVRHQLEQAIAGPGPYTVRTRDTSYITPFFQFGVTGEFALPGYLPVLRSIPLINTARFRVGYDYTLIAEMARPAQVIQYNVDVPEIKSKRQNNSIKTVNFGLDWTF